MTSSLLSATLAQTSTSVAQRLADDPGRALVAAGAVAGLLVLALLGTAAMNRYSLSVQFQVLTLGTTMVGVGGVVAAALVWLGAIQGPQVVAVAVVLLVMLPVSLALGVAATARLGRDLRRLGTTVEQVRSGERTPVAPLRRQDELGAVSRAVHELNANLALAEQEHAALETERAALLSSISHDLRTPLAALSVAVDALVDDVAPDPKRYLRAMRHDVDTLAALVEDLFLLVRLDAGRAELHYEPVDLAEVAEDAVEALVPAADAKDVTLALHAQTAAPLLGDGRALARVVTNLVANAIRHTPTGSSVLVVVRPEPSGGARLWVLDDGEGFPDEFVPRAFEAFSRADDSRTRATGGAGLGLAIVAGLVAAHGGHVTIEAPPGGRVRCEFPPPPPEYTPDQP